MTEQKFEISNEQAQRFARSLYADIASYVAQHQEEFEGWKQSKQEKRSTKNEKTDPLRAGNYCKF